MCGRWAGTSWMAQSLPCLSELAAGAWQWEQAGGVPSRQDIAWGNWANKHSGSRACCVALWSGRGGQRSLSRARESQAGRRLG